MTYEYHEAANLFPLDEEHLDELAADIKANGQRVPIELCDGKIVDGRRRYAACTRAGIEPKAIEVRPSDPVSYVLSLNLHRRHLTPSQRAMVGARARKMYDHQAKERQKDHGGTAPGSGKNTSGNFTGSVAKGDSRDLAGKAVGVSGTYIDRATKVIASAIPEVIDAVDGGRMSVTTAAVLSSEPADVQREEATKPKRNRTYNSVSAPLSREPDANAGPDEGESNGKVEVRGVGIARANEAINCLTRIPKNDALRKRGFQLVTDWIRNNK